MLAVSPRALFVVLALAAAGLYGCGKGAPAQLSGGGSAQKLAPVATQGAVSVATRNTTRLGGADTAADAAAVARAVYPGLTPATRPQVVVLVNNRDWLGALAASVLASAPTNAPILFSEGKTIPAVTRETLEAMHPLGAPALGGAQVIEIGTSAVLPHGYLTQTIDAAVSSDTAAEVERTLDILDHGSTSHQAIVLAANEPRALAMPAAGLAAESGAPILFVTPTRVSAPTASVLTALNHPAIYVVDPSAIGARTLHALRHYGTVRSITGAHLPTAGHAAVQNAIEVARFTDGTFGWGVKEPGHGLVFANEGRPLDAPATALLAATGDYAPLLLVSTATQVPPGLVDYLSDIQPAYTSAPQFQPVRGVYNHGWLIGDEQAMSAISQAEIDSLLEISPRPQNTEENSVSQVE
jgi:ell wall binding domain 2 (CWB2)